MYTTYDIYKIDISSGVYVGSTGMSLKDRWSCHRNKLKRGVHPCKALQMAFDTGEVINAPITIEKVYTDNKNDALMCERLYQLEYKVSGQLLNTKIEKDRSEYSNLAKFDFC